MNRGARTTKDAGEAARDKAGVRLRWVVPALTLTVLSGTLASPAFAQQASVAEELFQQARALMAEGRVTEACAKFEESERLEPATGTLLNLAVCHDAQGRTATAWSEYRQARDRARRDGRPDRVEFAEKHLEELEPRLTRLLLHSEEGEVPGLELRLDAQLLGAAALGVAFPIDPGVHRLDVIAPDRVGWSASIQIPAAPEVVEITLPQLRSRPAEAQPSDSAHQAPQGNGLATVASSPADVTAGASPLRSAAYVSAGVGLVGVALGVTFGAVALGKKSEANCSATCADAEAQETMRQANAWADGADVAFIVGGAALVTGVTLFLLSRKTTKSVALPWVDVFAHGVRF